MNNVEKMLEVLGNYDCVLASLAELRRKAAFTADVDELIQTHLDTAATKIAHQAEEPLEAVLLQYTGLLALTSWGNAPLRKLAETLES